jgi:hypothetical protein
MKGYFVVDVNDNEPLDIKFELHPEYAKEKIPQNQEDLYNEIENTNNVIKSLHYTKEEVKNKYFKKLLSLSQAGLVGETAQPDLALKSLNSLKAEMILVEGARIKNEYMKNLGKNMLILSSFMLIIMLIAYFIFKYFHIISPISMYGLAFIGALLGTWVSFGARSFKITFEQLSLLEEDMMSPWIRLLYIGVCSIIFMLFLNTQLISISVGSISTTTIKTNCEIQMAIGVVCGLVESKIGINLHKKAVNLLSNSQERSENIIKS